MSYNLTNERIDQTYQQLVQVSGSNLVNGTGSVITDINVTASNALTANTSITSSYTLGVEWNNIDNIPSGIVSSSAQIAGEISGAFNDTSASLSGRVTTLEQFSSSLDATFATDAQLSAVSASLASDITVLDGRLDTLDSKTLLSSSAQIASDISGAFTDTSASLSGRVNSLEQFSSSLDATYATDAELASVSSSLASTITGVDSSLTTLSGSTSTRLTSLENFSSSLDATFATDAELNAVSSSLASDVTGLDGRLDTLEGKTLLSSSAQIANEISGAFNSVSGSLAGRVDSLEQFSSSLDATFATDAELSSVSSSLASDLTNVSTSLNTFSGSASTRLTSLEQFSSSLDATYATDAELAGVSSSIASDITGLDGRLDTLEGKTLLSSSAQIASDISGAFTSVSASIATDVSGLDTRLDTLEGKTLVSGSSQITLIDTTGNLSGSRIVGNVPSATTASYASNAELLDGRDSTVFATTGSNSFIGNQTVTGTVNITGALTASGLIYPTVDGLERQTLLTDGNGNLSFDDITTFYEDVYSGENLTKGDPLYVSGSQGANPKVFKADASNPAKMPVLFVASETIGANNSTRGITLGLIEGIDLTGIPVGTEVYVAPGGGWTTTRPTGTSIVQSLGYVTKEGNGGKGLILNPGPNSLPNLPSGQLWVGDNNSHATTIASSSFAKVGQNNTFTGTQTFNNITVNGTGSFGYIKSVTGSAKIIGDAFIILNNDLPAEPYAGIKVIDSGSTDVTASLLWDGANNHWIYENVSGSSYGAGGLMAGPRSTDINNILYPTQYKVLRSQGGDHIYDSNITDNDTNVSISIPLSVTGDITGSGKIKSGTGFIGNLTGNADTATTASYASNVDFSNINGKPTLVSGSSQIDYTGLSNIPVGILSSSAQIATEISGAFTDTSASLSGRVTSLESFSSSLDSTFATDAQLTSVSSSLASDLTGLSSSVNTLSGSTSTRLTNLENFSSSLDSTFATDAELTAVSSSLASTITGVDGRLITLEGKTLLSSSAQIASDISGAFTSVSSSIAGDITGLDSRLDTLEGKTLISSSNQVNYTQLSNIPVGILSSSAQIASDISGAFTDTSSSLSTRVTSLESFSSSLDATFATDAELTSLSSSVAGDITGLDSRLDTLENKTLVSGSSQITLQSTTGNLSGSRIDGLVTSASFALTASYLEGYISPFPYTGSAVITGSLEVTGSVTVTSLTGSGERVVLADSNGQLVPSTQTVIQAYINPTGSAAILLDNTGSWDINGLYIGSTITGTYQGQKHYNTDYFFEAVDDNNWIRLIRG